MSSGSKERERGTGLRRVGGKVTPLKTGVYLQECGHHFKSRTTNGDCLGCLADEFRALAIDLDRLRLKRSR